MGALFLNLYGASYGCLRYQQCGNSSKCRAFIKFPECSHHNRF